jgi:hypothetical protein
MQKRTPLFLLFTAILTLSIAITAFAAGTQYRISAINVILTVPDGLYSLTRNVSEGNKALEILDADPEELYAVYQQKGIYLDAFPQDLSYELVLVATEVDDDDFTTLSDEALADYESSLIEEYAAMENETLLSVSQYMGNETPYLVTSSYYKDDYVSSYAIKYYTVVDHTGYHYILQTNDTELTDEHLSMLNQLVDSAQYTEVSASVTESPFFTSIMETLIGGGISIGILVLILFLLIRGSQKKL